jgi:peptidoglycan/xylan/chitin deacetylase (PgdA/CDA1 family)
LRRAALLATAGSLASCIVAPPPAASSEPAKAPLAKCAWPNGAKAAVSLTYDDGLGSQVQYAVPVLDRYDIKATFFLSGAHMDRFAPLANAGHELASHTIKHPCNAELAALDLTQMASELDASIAAVQALGPTGKLSFAYPCGQMQLKGMESYVPLVKARFVAARGVAGVVADPAHVDLFRVPALFPPTTSDGSDVIAFIEQAEQSGGWAVIGVHGVSEAGEYLQWSQPAHDQVVAYLAEHRQRLWTAPFASVASSIAACRYSAAGK